MLNWIKTLLAPQPIYVPAPAPAPAFPSEAVVRDRFTGTVIFEGTAAECRDYVEAFGLCYVETR